MKTFRHLQRGSRLVIGVLGLGASLIIVTTIAYTAAYWQKMLPGVRVNGLELANKTAEEGAKMIEEKVRQTDWELVARYQDREYKVSMEDLGLSWDVERTVNLAWGVGREGNLIERVGQAWKSFFKGEEVGVVVTGESGLEEWTEKLAKDIDSPLVKPSFNLKNGKVVYVTAKDGLVTDRQGLKQSVLERAASLKGGELDIPVVRQTVTVETETVKAAIAAAEKVVGKQLVFALDDEDWAWDDQQLVGLISVVKGGGFDETAVTEEVDSLSKGIDRQPQNAAFQFSDGKVSAFRPGKDGLAVEKAKLVGKIIESFDSLVASADLVVDVPVRRQPPQITTESVNDLGIKERLGVGKSTYKHSIPNRIHNVALAAGRINGVIVPPNSEFSFNDALGDVSGATGFLSAYVIQNGRTVLGDGGGVCQVSTTLFRAALDAGLSITERKAHAYRVGYYEQDSLPGIDATVFSPTADLRFKNDTPGYLLIQMAADSDNQKLVVEIYGSSDGRRATVSKPKVWGQSPPPPTLYQDDPTLPLGVTKQVDWAAAGAKVSFDYKVERDGQEIFSKTFFSAYQPWQAIYLRGTRI